MAQGNDKIAQSLMELQPTAVLEFFIIYPDILNYPTLKIFAHAGSLYDRVITWQGNKYIPVAIEVEGFEQNATAQLARPKIKISNKDFLITKLLHTYEDLKNAEIVRKRTFVKYLDDDNFDGGNPYSAADSSAELCCDRYVIGQKLAENKVFVELELASPLDLENFEVNHRRILGKYCYWQYRGEGCNYQGVPIQRGDGTPFTDADNAYVVPNATAFDNLNPAFQWVSTVTYNKGDIVFMENNKVLINSLDPNQAPHFMRNWYVAVTGSVGKRPDVNPSYWQKDACNKKLSSCKLRFSESALVAYQESETDYDYSRGHLTGLWSDNNVYGTGKFITQASAVTGAFLYTDFTVMLWVSGNYSTIRYPGFIQTADVLTESEFAFQLFGGTDNYPNRAYMYFDATYAQGFDVSSDQDLLFLIEWNATSRKLKTYVNRFDEAKLDVSPESSHEFRASEFSLGMGEYPMPGGIDRPASGKFGPCAIWQRILNPNEKALLLQTDNDDNRVPHLYSQMTGSLREDITGNNLVAWWETTGDVAGTLGLLDSHENGYHMTGWGFITGADATFSLDEPTTVYRKEQISVLPFGGFPGTDGFSYEA